MVEVNHIPIRDGSSEGMDGIFTIPIVAAGAAAAGWGAHWWQSSGQPKINPQTGEPIPGPVGQFSSAVGAGLGSGLKYSLIAFTIIGAGYFFLSKK